MGILTTVSEYRFIIILILGLLAFIVPLYAAFSSKFNLGTKLSTGEIRKSIVISFTIIYIMLLCISFDKTTDLATTNSTVFNIVTQGNTTFSTLNNTTAPNTISTQTVPIQALGNFTQNFLYVYVVIIGFYFGSRLGEHVMVLKDIQTVHSIDIARRRYAMGEIDSNVFDEIEKKLKGNSEPMPENPHTPK